MKKHHLFTTLFLLLAVFPCIMMGETETGLEGVIVVSPAGAGPEQAGVPNSAPLANVDFDVKKREERSPLLGRTIRAGFGFRWRQVTTSFP